jgi:glycosyltransferase involved in cell wall biosynthesis
LRYAAKKSGSTRAEGLEEMTISMLEGEEGRQASELDQLIFYLQKEIKPDVVHLSNGLLLGLAFRLKNDLGAKVVCSLQDENEWIDLMEENYQDKVWNLMAHKAKNVDLFVTTSQYYSDMSQKKLKIPSNKIKVIQGGIDPDGYQCSPLPFDPPVIGYLCRMSEYFGLGILIDAFLQLKKENRFPGLKLHLTGGYSSEDRKFVEKQMKKVKNAGVHGDVNIFKSFNREKRIGFLRSLTVLSVPVPGGEAFGAYQVEALTSCVPVVQPDVGCYPEFVENTQGGIIYTPNNSETLAQALSSLLADPEKVKKLGEQGRRSVLEKYSIKDMAKEMVKVYEEIT